ncbi:glycosyltransferase family 2 protein [Thalassotalea mangrovi]|uniref:Glycosyltransferase family 2 protein n=1 Tax=Thalassotalea mangrovi TaxID=2572245 RepID=A0A4U1B870_9GAMM|nr:glycosyltransferase family 2 protein [Thalassotalea mangrovi]TKB46452.1 glycosyltransferase family 2 protein [Thalassotalea mangrovi]
MEISVVVPAKNEQENIQPLVEEINQALSGRYKYEIIYVDDGSEDETYQRLVQLRNKQDNIRIIRHRQSVGQSTAVRNGVKQSQGSLVATLDADGQNDPADLPAMIDIAMQQSQYSHFCVAGYRKNRIGDNSWKRWQSKVANNIRQAFLDDDSPDTGCGIKVIPRATFMSLPYFDHMHRFLPALIKRRGGHIEVVEVNHRKRYSGQSNYSFRNRAFVGLVDLLGVLWLKSRYKRAEIIETKHD